ncbi:MAG: baseplate J family protein, partial [Candidatus Magnetoglobus multicellularis str. Araruama]
MIDLSALPEITCQASYADILNELKDAYHSATGKILYPSDDITFLLEIIAYQRMVLEYGIMHESKQNLLAYAKGYRLDHIAAMNGLTRLEATCAVSTFRFQFVAHDNNVIVIPKQFQIAKDDVIFQTTHDHLVAIDQTTADIKLQCTQAGTIGNGYIAGEINQIVQPMPFLSQAENITVSAGGAEKEADEAFRNRIQFFPESISAAGPEKAYIFMTKSCHPDVVDVSVSTPTTLMAELAETVSNY